MRLRSLVAAITLAMAPSVQLIDRLAAQPLDRAAEVDFDRDVRPILSDLCFGCHGPDQSARKADLRLDLRTGLFASLDEGFVVKSGQPEQSELLRRIRSTDDSISMPPQEFGRRATGKQIEIIERWITQGARWQPHWSFRRIERPELPQASIDGWAENAIDLFVAAQLEREKLKPTKLASPESLVRRLALDLTGLPPTPEEVADFVSDVSPNAVAQLVDRLLASPEYGERLAVDWLDGARYADTSGYQNDGPRHMWRWRDWVIDAFNRNLPFDHFTFEQIAGDLLPHASVEQRIATGFQRNHRGNAEGGIVPEEFAVEYVVDRVETTSAVWLGLTVGCARCHDHKYDPISQQEFYELFAFFNNIPEHGRAIKEGNSPPYVVAPTEQQQQQLEALDARLADAEQAWSDLQSALAAEQARWEEEVCNHAEQLEPSWYPQRNLLMHFDGEHAQPLSRFDAYATDGKPRSGDGPLGQAIELDGEQFVEIGDVAKFGYFDKFSFALWIKPQRPSGTILSRMTDAPEGDGYSLVLDHAHLQLNLVKRWLDDAIRLETTSAVPLGEWTHVAASYDGSRKAAGVRLYVNGAVQQVRVKLDFLNQSFASPDPLRIGAGNGPENRFVGSIDEARAYDRVLTDAEMAALASRQSIVQLAAIRRDKRTVSEQFKLQSYYLDARADKRYRDAFERLQNLRDERLQVVESLPTVMVMEELPSPKATFVLMRGQYDQPLTAVSPGVPACLPVLPENAPKNRLALAKWLTSRDQPLTARVIVNRYWQMLFGVGLVKTAEDFGLQGERPSHPELLDWLAAELIESNWDLKNLLKLIVTSATYRQSSEGSEDSWHRDPANRWLSRGPRFRLNAEMIRDSALAAGGLLSSDIGGPSLKPYQPAGLWNEIATDTQYEQAQGAGLYRRSLYTYWKRTVAPPGMQTFDAPSRETCVVRRPITNTPLQALQLMNEEGYLEAARHLALRALRESSSDPRERLSRVFQFALARRPNELELAVLVRTWEAFVDRYRAQPQAAELALAIGQSATTAPSPESHQLAAYAAVASLILNLDEAITKE